MILYRPVGLQELKLIAESGYRAFPPRLPEQPIVYPVLNFEFAEQIASRWNTEDPNSGYAGIVLRFEVEDAYVRRFPVQVVGEADVHQGAVGACGRAGGVQSAYYWGDYG